MTVSKLPAFRHSVKRGMSFESPHVAREQAEPNRAAPVAVVDAVDERREFLAPVVVGREQIRLMMAGRNEIEQHDTG